MAKKIAKREIRFSVHIPAKDNYREDTHYIKECITYEDGSTSPNSYIVKNLKRPVWVTKEAYRNYKEKREFEDVDRLHKVEVTQSEINKTVARLLDLNHLSNRPRELKQSPYLYGYDISSTAYIKLRSLIKNEFLQSIYSLCVLDIEATPFDRELLLITVSMKGKSFTGIISNLFKTSKGYKEILDGMIEKYVPHYKDKHKFEYGLFNTDVQLIRAVFNKLHEWKPDILTLWNMDYDIPVILEKLENAKINPSMIIADPSIPRELKVCRYLQGTKKKVTASGTVKPIPPSLQWHTLVCTSSFYVLDAMCVYRQIRAGQAEEPSYSLDSILQKEGITTQKLKFEEANKYKKDKWHTFMAANYPYEYVIYNICDTLSVLELEEKTGDLTSKFPMFVGITDFNKFTSNPKKIVDSLFKFGLENYNRVIGTGGIVNRKPDEDEELDIEPDENDVNRYETLDLRSWIQTLQQHLLVTEGVNCLSDHPKLDTSIRLLVFDSDVISSYPTVTDVANVSKETTRSEVIEIEGVDEYVFRSANLGLIASDANTGSYMKEMFDLPCIMTL